MNSIKQFIDKISVAEGRNARDLVLTLAEAKQLRDEITKILLDQHESRNDDEVIQVEMRGGKFK